MTRSSKTIFIFKVKMKIPQNNLSHNELVIFGYITSRKTQELPSMTLNNFLPERIPILLIFGRMIIISISLNCQFNFRKCQINPERSYRVLDYWTDPIS